MKRKYRYLTAGDTIPANAQYESRIVEGGPLRWLPVPESDVGNPAQWWTFPIRVPVAEPKPRKRPAAKVKSKGPVYADLPIGAYFYVRANDKGYPHRLLRTARGAVVIESRRFRTGVVKRVAASTPVFFFVP